MKLDGEQIKVINTIKRIGAKRYGRGSEQYHRYVKAALETGAVESNFRNLHYGDSDSQGWRQERQRYYSDPTNLRASINRFFNEAEQLDRGQQVWKLAADVQRPAAQYRTRYRDKRHLASALLKQDGGSVTLSGRSGTYLKGTAPSLVPGQTKVDDTAALTDALLQGHGKPGLLKRYQALVDSGNYTATTPTSIDAGKSPKYLRGPKVSATVKTDGKNGPIKITGPNPGRIRPEVKQFMRQIAGVAGMPVVGSDGTGHSKYTTNGRVSEHYTGNASDIPAVGAKLMRLGRAALVAAGMDPKKARKAPGGLYNLYRNGVRYQIIFGINDPARGGNHTDHLHVGVSRSRGSAAGAAR